MDIQDPSLGLPPALPIPATPSTSANVDPNFQNQATIQWTEVNPLNRSWFLNVVAIADIKKDIADRQKAADEALDGFEIISPGIGSTQVVERIIFLNFRVLHSLPYKFVQEEPHNVLRKTIVRLIHRLALMDVSRALHNEMIASITQIIDVDNEEIGIQCLKLLLEIVKLARPPMNQPAGPLFGNVHLTGFVIKLLRRWASLPSVVEKILEMGSMKIPLTGTATVDIVALTENLLCSIDIVRSVNDETNTNAIVLLPKGNSSLRFLAESIYLIMYSQQYMRSKIHEVYPTFGPEVVALMAVDVNTAQIDQFIQSLATKPSDQARVTGAYHEFMLTYCKIPQLFAYVARHFVSNTEQTNVFGDGVVRLLTICPKEIVWGRRDILGAIKLIANSEWRNGLLPHIPQIVDVDFLVGPANGSKDLLKATAVTMAMEVLHFVRPQLNFTTFEQAINLCISYFCDRTLGIGLHMSVLRTISTNLSESILNIARQEEKLEECRLLFIRLLNMLSLRLKVMVKYSLPVYKSKVKSAVSQGVVVEPADLIDNSSQILTEQRAFLRAIIAAVKSFQWCIHQCGLPNQANIRPEDLKILTRICKYGVQATELFVLGNGPHTKSTPSLSGKPSEKEFTEHVADTMKQFPFDVYRDIFQHIFWRFLELFKDDQLQQILSAALNCLLPYPGFSGITTTTMLDVAIPRFPELAEASLDVSSSVLQIFKILFGAVSLYPKEVEQYFKPLVQKIFQQGFHLAMRARDPFNLFLMFRAFFRAMGSGGHEVLYHDFLPNFPMILQILCTFHSQRQKPAFKDIFNELCLIVPVRLSTLMPHISLLAPAILAAMQGSASSVSQGLRTLELSIDNMQSDFLYEQLEPVKKELMKALWNIMITGNGQMQISALRFLGKICGHALKSIREPQQLHPRTMDDDLGPCLTLSMPNITDPLHVPIFRVIEEAYKTLLEPTVDLTTRCAAWNIVQNYLLGVIRPDANMQAVEDLLHHPSFRSNEKKASYMVVTSLNPDVPYQKCSDEKNRLATQTCLQGLMVAAATKDFRNTAMPLLAKFVRHFSLMAIVQQHGSFSKPEAAVSRVVFHHEAIDPFVLLDAIVFVLGQEEAAISKTADAAIMLILETLTAVYEDLKNCISLPFLTYLFEKLHSLCYDKAWGCKAGALTGIGPLIDYMPHTWTMEMSALLVRALMFILRDSFQKMTYGIIDVTKKLIVRILKKVLAGPDEDNLPPEVQSLRQQALQEIIREFIQNSCCVVDDVRKQTMDGLKLIAETLNKPLGEVLEPYKKLIGEFVPPKGPSAMKSYQMAHQTALLEANEFFLTATPTVVSYDQGKQEDVDIIMEILEFVTQDDDSLSKKYQCFDFRQYHPLSFLPYRIACFRFLTVFATFPMVASHVHQTLFDTLIQGSEDLLDVSTDCLANFSSRSAVGEDTVKSYVEASKTKLQNPSFWNKDLSERLCRLQKLYPSFFDEDFATTIFSALPPNMDVAAVEQKDIPHICDGVKKCALMITLLRRTTNDPKNFVTSVVELVAQTEEALMARNGRHLTNALSGFLLGHGPLVIDMFFADDKILQPKWMAFFEKLLKGKDELPAELKRCLTTDKLHLVTDLLNFSNDTEKDWESLSVGIRILYLVTKKDPQWLISRPDVVTLLRAVWMNPHFHARLRNISAQQHDTWELSVKFLVLLMVHVRIHCEDFDALFEMARHSSRSIAEGSRWRQFVECHIVLNLPPQHRRQMFLKWLDLVKNRTFGDEHLAEICDLVIQPVLKQQFMQPSAELMVSETSKSDPNQSQGNLIGIAVQTLIGDEIINKVADVLRVSILKLLVLFTEHGENYFPQPKTTHSVMLARFAYVACTFLQRKERDHIQVDVGTIFQSQNLLAQVSVRYAIPQRFYLSILRSLFAGGIVEPRGSNKSAIDILLPNLLSKNEGATLCCRYLRRCITDDMANLPHNSIIFQAVVRHYAAFYNYRWIFISLMIQNAQKLGLSSTTGLDLKRTAVDMIECIVHWEAMRKGVETDYGEATEGPSTSSLLKDWKGRVGQIAPGREREEKGLDQRTVDSVANILLRLSFMFGETGATDSFGRRCIRILKFFMRRDMCPNAEVRLQWMDKILASLDQTGSVKLNPSQDQPVQPAANNVASICLALETLTYFIPLLMRSTALNVIQDLSSSLMKVTMCFHPRIGKCMNQLISMLCSTWPGDPVLRNLPLHLENLYAHIIKVIHEGLSEFEKITPGPQVHIFCTLMLLKATIPHIPSILERFLTLVVNCAKKITDEHLGIKVNNQQPPSQDGIVSAELVVVVLDVIKVAAFFNSSGVSHRQSILGIMGDLIGRGSDVRVHRALIRIFDDWLHAAEKQQEPLSFLKNLSKLPRKPKKRRDEDGTESLASNDEKKKKKFPKKVLLEPGLLMPPALPPPPEETQTVTSKELGALILKLQVQLERKFVDDSELQLLYTKMIYRIFQADDQKILDLQQRLVNAYMYGLRHPDPEWRKKFYAIHDRDYAKNMYERVGFLFNGFNWDVCTFTYYIGFCINSILDVATNLENPVELHNIKPIPPVAASENGNGQQQTEWNREKTGLSDSFSEFDTSSPDITTDEPPKMKELSVGTIVERVYKLNDMSRNTVTRPMLDGIYQLCHARNQLANDLWVVLMPQIWKLLSGEQRDGLVQALKSYLMTQSHQAQRDLIHFPIQAMFDAMSKCEGIQLKLHPMSIVYLGERQNLWYRSALLLEEMAIPTPVVVPNQKGATKAIQQQFPSETDPSAAMQQIAHGVLWVVDESLARMYTALGEDDFAAAIWQLRGTLTPKSDPQVPKPSVDFRAGLGFERQGLLYDARESYEKAMDTFLVECRDKPAPDSEFSELQVLAERYGEVLKQLNQWPELYQVAISENVNNPCLALEAAWHQDSFDVVPTLLQTAFKQCPPRDELNFGFCKAYNSMHKVLKEGLANTSAAYKDEGVDKLIECLQQMCIKLWRHLPKTGTMAHKPLIEMAARVGDLKELLGILPAVHCAQGCTPHHVGTLRNMVKNWKIRVPGFADDCRFWGEITDLRSQILTHVINLSTEVQHATSNSEVATTLSSFPIVSIHTISQNYFYFAKAARMQQLPKLSVEILSRVQTLPVVPLVDCYERVKNHVLACLMLFNQTGNQSDLESALEAIGNVHLNYFTKEMVAELSALKGQVAMKMQKMEDGQKFLSAAVQMYENCFEGWLKFGDYYEALFQKNPTDLNLAKQAVVCYVFGTRSNLDHVARECSAKMIALLNHDNASSAISSAIEESVSLIPHVVLVFWVPQLIHLMMRKETAQAACTLLVHIAKHHPQPVYLHVRTYFLLMKAVELSKDSTAPMGASLISQPSFELKSPNKRRRNVPRDLPPIPSEDVKNDPDTGASGDGATMRASSFVMNCVTIMRSVSDSHPTICNALECFASQILGITMSADRWYEELLAHLIQALKSCYVLAFENRDRVMQARMTPSMIQYMNTIVRSFGTGVYQEPGTGTVSKAFGDVASEAIQRRAQSLQASTDYNKLKKDFVKDFDCAEPDNLKLQSMISKLKKWIRTFEKTIKSHPNYTYLDTHHRPLINFTNLTADMELPGDFTVQRNPHVNKVSQILPRMDVVFKHNVVCRRIYFVNNVGETIPYLIIADNANTLQGRKEERVLQLFLAMNPILDDFPEANRRALKYYVPKVTPIAPAVRLMEDSQNSVCVWDIYKKYCDKKNIDSDGPIMKFYERIVANLHRNNSTTTQQVLRECLKETQIAMVQPRVLRDYFWKLYTNADEYFLFRRSFLRSHAILCMAEHVLRLTKLTPDMMHVHTESGVMGVYSFTFEMDERSGERLPARAVPFRLTPNLTEIFTCYGVQGPFLHSIVAATRALKQNENKFKAYVKTIFCDELTYWMVFRKEMSLSLAFADAIQLADKSEATTPVTPVTATKPPLEKSLSEPNIHALTVRGLKQIFNDLNEAHQFNGHESAALKMINIAKSPDNLCRMDPSWHPWL